MRATLLLHLSHRLLPACKAAALALATALVAAPVLAQDPPPDADPTSTAEPGGADASTSEARDKDAEVALEDVVHLVTGVALRAKVVKLGSTHVEVIVAGGERQSIPQTNVVSIDYGAGNAALAQPEQPADDARAPDPPPERRSGRIQASLLGGLVMPTEMTPERVFPTHMGVGPFFRLEATVAPIRVLELGVYTSLSRHPISEVEGYDGEVDGGATVFRGGATIKGRIFASPAAVVRLGVELGANHVGHELASGTEFSGSGFNFGPTVDFRGLVGEHVALVAMLGFMSQIAGSAELPASVGGERDVDFTFPPTVFFAVGPELVY